MDKLKPDNSTFIDKHKGKISAALFGLWALQGKEITTERVNDSITRNMLDRDIVEGIGDNYRFFNDNTITPIVASIILAAGRHTTSLINDMFGSNLTYEISNPQIIRQVDRSANAITKNLEMHANKNLGNTLLFARQNDITANRVRDLMILSGVVLTEKEHNIILRQVKRLIDSETPDAEITRMIKRKAKAMRKNRADKIAYTETQRQKESTDGEVVGGAVAAGVIAMATKTWERNNFVDNWESSVMYDGLTIGVFESFAQFGIPAKTTMSSFSYPSEINEYCTLSYGLSK